MATPTKVTIDHDEIRQWAERRRARPTVVKGTGIIRLDFPGYSGEGKLQPKNWDEFFRRFDESNLAFIYQDKTARGQTSNFNKLVGRETVDLESGAKTAPPRRRRRTQTTRSTARATTEKAQGTTRARPKTARGAKHGTRSTGKATTKSAGRSTTRTGKTRS
jgi:hypothetical protein